MLCLNSAPRITQGYVLLDAKESLPPVGSDWEIKLPMAGKVVSGGTLRL